MYLYGSCIHIAASHDPPIFRVTLGIGQVCRFTRSVRPYNRDLGIERVILAGDIWQGLQLLGRGVSESEINNCCASVRGRGLESNAFSHSSEALDTS